MRNCVTSSAGSFGNKDSIDKNEDDNGDDEDGDDNGGEDNHTGTVPGYSISYIILITNQCNKFFYYPYYKMRKPRQFKFTLLFTLGVVHSIGFNKCIMICIIVVSRRVFSLPSKCPVFRLFTPPPTSTSGSH